ncbi:MAG: hypothetical protein ACXWA3_08160 [Acidimicrobiales bacterium]
MTFHSEDLDDDEDDRRAWARAGVPADEVAAWKRWHLEPGSAGTWRRAGVEDPLAAAQWETAGVTPSTVGTWTAEGIAPDEAVRWHEFGFDLDAVKAERAAGRDPQQALAARSFPRFPGPTGGSSIVTGRSATAVVWAYGGAPQDPRADAFHRFVSSGVDQRLVHEYMRRQWIDDDAIAWARWGLTPTDADHWHDLGLTAGEAGPLARQGWSPAQVMRAWWSTGIPFDEVAEWIGAGLTAAEAVEQIARGVTTEQAAALRALRPEGEPSGSRRSSLLWERRGGPGSEPVGAPPEDEESARREISDAYARMLETFDDEGGLALVDGGSNLGPSIEAARARVQGAAQHSVTTVTVTDIRFVNDHLARVAWDVDVRGQISTQLRDLVGEALLIEGRWMVGRETVTELLGMAGASCPPRPEPPEPAV